MLETDVKAAGRWRYVYRAAGRHRCTAVLERAISTTKIMPSEVVTDLAPTYPVVLERTAADGVASY